MLRPDPEGTIGWSPSSPYGVVMPQPGGPLDLYVKPLLHDLVMSVAPSNTVDAWAAELRRVSGLLARAGVLGSDSGAEGTPYVRAWLCRNLMLLKNHMAGIKQLTLQGATVAQFVNCAPDRRGHVEGFARQVAASVAASAAGNRRTSRKVAPTWKTMTVEQLFEALHFTTQRPELFSMYCCFFDQARRTMDKRRCGADWVLRNAGELKKLGEQLSAQHGSDAMPAALFQTFHDGAGHDREAAAALVSAGEECVAAGFARMTPEFFRACVAVYQEHELAPPDLTHFVQNGAAWLEALAPHAGVLLLVAHLRLPPLRDAAMAAWKGQASKCSGNPSITPIVINVVRHVPQRDVHAIAMCVIQGGASGHRPHFTQIASDLAAPHSTRVASDLAPRSAEVASDLGPRSTQVASDLGPRSAEVASDLGPTQVASDLGPRSAQVASNVATRALPMAARVRAGVTAVFPTWQGVLREAETYHLLADTVGLLAKVSVWPDASAPVMAACAVLLAAKSGQTDEGPADDGAPVTLRERMLQAAWASCDALGCSKADVVAFEPRFLNAMSPNPNEAWCVL